MQLHVCMCITYDGHQMQKDKGQTPVDVGHQMQQLLDLANNV